MTNGKVKPAPTKGGILDGRKSLSDNGVCICDPKTPVRDGSPREVQPVLVPALVAQGMPPPTPVHKVSPGGGGAPLVIEVGPPPTVADVGHPGPVGPLSHRKRPLGRDARSLPAEDTLEVVPQPVTDRTVVQGRPQEIRGAVVE